MTFTWASDRSLLVSCETEVYPLFRRLHAIGLEGVTDFSPARRSVLIRFDPLKVDHFGAECWIRRESKFADALEDEGRLVEVPVAYDGPDLDELAQARGLTTAEVIRIHTSATYRAYFLGFVPGFAYLGEVPDAIAAPRRKTPRREVPAGSVRIGGTQTGVYPRSTPGGWNLIGRTESVMFDAARGASLIEPGDRVRFVAL